MPGRTVGIEAMNFYGGTASLDVFELARRRGLDMSRFENLLMKERTVPMPYEDPVSLGVNAAKPIIDALTEEEKNRIEMVVTCSESGIDFGKSMSTYIHDYLGLNRNCRLFEVKNACYSGTAGFQMAVNFILAGVSPGAKALVVATDLARFMATDAGEALQADWSFAEPSGGAGAVAMLVSDRPKVFRMDIGANGYYGYEVMDTCRPIPDSESGNADLSLLSYLDCSDAAWAEYCKRVPEADYATTFQYLVFHTPFGGMIKGAHRNRMRKQYRMKPDLIEQDFQARVMPGLNFCQRVGNIMGATIFLSLVSTLCNGDISTPKRIGCFSYGSGCCSEFYSGVAMPEGAEQLKALDIPGALDRRYHLSFEQYESLLHLNGAVAFGTRNIVIDRNVVPEALQQPRDRKILILNEIKEFHREYVWL